MKRNDPLARRQPLACAFMARWFEGFVRRHMNGLRVARWGLPQAAAGRPLVIYSNHPSWWDAAVYVVLGSKLLRDRVSFAPIDAAMLRKYGFFARIGAFPVDLDSRRGAADFLATAGRVLAAPDRALWVTAQGRFADARARPLGLRAGVARLPELAADAVFLPLAIDYTFWSERGAEALVAFGEPLEAGELAAMARPQRLARLEEALAATMDRLAVDAISREPGRFLDLTLGRQGVGGVYDLWRRGRAWLGGRRFEPAHQELRP